MKQPVRLGSLALLACALAVVFFPAPASAQAREDPNLRRGRIHFKSGKYTEAINELRTALRRNNRNAEAHLWIGKALVKTSELQKAVDHLQKAIQYRPDNEESYKELGAAYLNLHGRAQAKGQGEAAKEYLEKANEAAKTLLQRRPRSKESYEFLVELADHRARVYRAQNQREKEQDQYDEALRYCEKVLEIDERDISTHLKRIELLLSQKRFKECKRRCREVLKINPQLHHPKLILARIHRASGDNEGAIKILTEVIDAKKTQLGAILRRAEIYLDMQKYEKALADANEAIRLTNRNPYANFIRGCVYMQLKKLDAAIQELQQAVAGMPQHLPSHFWLARCYLLKDMLREAVAELNTVVKIDSRFTAARLILASAHLQSGYADGAISTLLDAIAFEPDNVEVRRLLGVAYLHKGEYDRADQQFKKMLEYDPEQARAHQVRAGIALGKNRIDQAIDHCLKALDVEPKNVDVHFLLGLAYLKRNRLDGARRQFERVLELRGRHPGARMNLAAVHIRLREYDLAEEQYRRCIEEDPTLTRPRYHLARLYGLQRKYDKAESELTQLLKIESERAKVHLAMAGLHRAKGEKEKAVQAANAALAIDPKLLAARVFMARVYMAEQNWPSALEQLNAALNEDPKFAPAYEAAVIQVYLGRYDEGVKLFEKAVSNDLARASSLAGAAAALQLKGDYRGALANISQADKEKPRDPLITLQNANIYLAQGDAPNARILIRQAVFLPEFIRNAFLALVEDFAADKARSKAVADALTRVIFYGARGWHTQAEQNCNLLLKLAPKNTFAHTVLANVYRITARPQKEIDVVQRLIDVSPKEHRHRLRLGRLLLAVSRFKDARRQFEKAKEVDPKAPEPRLALGAYFLKTAQYDLCAKEAKEALELEQGNPQALALLASCQLAERKFDEAKKTLQSLAESKGAAKGPLPLLQLAELELLEGKVDEAIKRYREALESNPRSIQARMRLAGALLRKGQVSDATEQFKEVLSVDPTYSPALLALARIYRLSGRLALALRTCERAAKISPSAVQVRFELAAIQLARGRHQEAIAEYKLVLKDRANDLRAKIGIAEATFRSGDRAAAIQQLTDLLKQRGSAPPAQAALVSFYKRLGDIDKAQGELETLVTTTPELPGAYDLAILYIHKDRLDDALRLVGARLRKGAHPSLILARGTALQLKGQLDDARKAFAEARKADPKSPRLASLLANAHLAAGQHDKAREIIQSVKKVQPEVQVAYVKLIDQLKDSRERATLAGNALNQAALYADGNWLTLARDRYESLLGSLPDNLAVLHLLANTYERLRDSEKAMATYQRMLRARPNYDPALRQLARHHVMAGRNAAAAKIFQNLLDINPKDMGVQLALASALQQQRKTKEAIARYKAAIKQDENNPIAYNNLAWLYATETNNLKEAEALALRAVDLTGADSGAGAAVRDTLAWIYYLSERYEKAMELAHQAIEGMPGSAEVHYHLGMIYFKRNLRASAVRHLTTALRLEPEFEHKDEIDSVLDRIRRRRP